MSAGAGSPWQALLTCAMLSALPTRPPTPLAVISPLGGVHHLQLCPLLLLGAFCQSRRLRWPPQE